MKDEKILDRIRKLLALSASNSGATAAERESALEMATALMVKYGIDHGSIKDEKGRIKWSDWIPLDKPWYFNLASAAGVLYGCQPVYIIGTDGFKFVGREENQQAAINTLPFLLGQVELLYKEFLPRGLSKKDRARYRREFKNSCSLRVYARAKEVIEALELKGTSDCTALVVQDHRKQLRQEVEDFLDQDETVKNKDTRQITLANSKAISQGWEAGRRISLNQGVE